MSWCSLVEIKVGIFKKPKVVKNKDGKWELRNPDRGVNPIYQDSYMSYLNALSPLFEKAQDTCEFEFINTLLRVRELEGPGWDPFENTQRAFECISKLKKRIKDFYTTRHLFLWLYGHIIEASEPYEILANLINVCEGERFCLNNFPNKKRGRYRIPQSPSEKIDKLEQMASKINMSNCIFPLRDVFDRDLRNAIFHSDYSLYKGEVRIRKPTKVYSHDEVMKVLNKGLAYFESFISIFRSYIRSYDKPKVIEVHKGFGGHPNEKAVTIIRKGHGLVGLKDNWTREELRRGHIPFRVGCFYRYEIKILDEDPLLAILPVDRTERANNILKILPKFISRRLAKRLWAKF